MLYRFAGFLLLAFLAGPSARASAFVFYMKAEPCLPLFGCTGTISYQRGGNATSGDFTLSQGTSYESITFDINHFAADTRVAGEDASGFTGGGAGAYVNGFYGDEITVAPPTGFSMGDPGTMVLDYHLTGNATVSVLPAIPGSLGNVAVSLACGSSEGECSGDTSTQANPFIEFTTTQPMDLHFHLGAPMQYGVPFQFTFSIQMESDFRAVASPSGFSAVVEADASHTGTLTNVSILDSQGNVVPNPLITAASGFDYADVGQASAVPEPALGYAVLPVILLVCGVKRYRSRHQRIAGLFFGRFGGSESHAN
jgi:hypothetical protein